MPTIDVGPFLFTVNATAIAGAGLWSTALYIGLTPATTWVTEQIDRWLNYAERSMYTSEQEFERTRDARESQNAFYASLLSIVPFLAIGSLCNLGVEWSLGETWAISMGLFACLSCGIYELGRRTP